MQDRALKSNGPILETREITLRFGGLEALNSLSISVEPHRVVSIIGPNGAGKTTLLRIINQITGPDSGELFLNGKKLTPDVLGLS